MSRFMRYHSFLCIALPAVALIFAGCSGGGGADRPPPDQGGEVIEMDDFIVEAGETRSFDTDTILRVAEEVRIDGEVTGADGSAPGEDGVSFTIEAGGEVVVNGTIRAGNGGEGMDALQAMSASGDGTAGGAGGSVTIRAGGEQAVASAEKQGDGPDIILGEGAQVAAGDGAGGGDSLTGGPGGKGGDVTLWAPEGTVSLAMSENLIHQGNGGHGGTGSIQGDDILDFPGMEEATAHGGDGGRLSIVAASLEGMEILGEPGEQYILLEEDGNRITGGAGGDGGPVVRGATIDDLEPDPELTLVPTSLRSKGQWGAVSPANGQEQINMLRGGDGGGAYATDDNGAGGDGGFAIQGFGLSLPDDHVGARGGIGGELRFNTYTTPDGREVPIIPRKSLSGGPGGTAWVKGRTGADGGQCQAATDGGSASAWGGDGGRINEDSVAGTIWQHPILARARGGNGGRASADAGDGGNAGYCCDPPGPAHPGGHAGRSAFATGGKGADQVNVLGGHGGAARASGGNGGDGGDGIPAGLAGNATASVSATGGAPGTGRVGGHPGSEDTRQGEDGSRGEPCEGPSPGISYDLATLAPGSTYQYSAVLRMMSGAFGGSVPRQVGETILGSAGSNPIRAGVGQTIAFTANGQRLFIATNDQGILIYDNPMSGGDRPPSATLSPAAASSPESLWYDAERDHLYVAVGADVMVWHGASALSGNPAPNRTIEVEGVFRLAITGITGDAPRRILYLAVAGSLYAFDEVHGLNGPEEVHRMITTGHEMRRSLACDSSRNRLYAGGRDVYTNANKVLVIADASEANGAVEPVAAVETGQLQVFPIALAVFDDPDELLVGVLNERLLLFRNASELADGSTADAEMDLDINALGARLR